MVSREPACRNASDAQEAGFSASYGLTTHMECND